MSGLSSRRQDRMMGWAMMMFGWLVLVTLGSYSLWMGLGFGGALIIGGTLPIIASFQENKDGSEKP